MSVTFANVLRAKHLLNQIIALLVLAALSAPSLHDAVHHSAHEHEIADHHCSEALEHDACHRMTTHHDGIAECDHDGHLNEEDDECDLCDWTHHRQRFTLSSTAESPFEIPIVISRNDVIERTSRQHSADIFLRGPPLLV